jgi:Arc/MetJ-type ribon-helix-helix transcriptional regulator
MKKTFKFGSGRLGSKIGVIAVKSDSKELKDLLGQFSRGEGRGNVVMVRMSDDALARIDQLVEATLFASRSECAAFLIGAGIESQKVLFERLSAHTEEIRKLKEQLREVALDALKPKGTSETGPPSPGKV